MSREELFAETIKSQVLDLGEGDSITEEKATFIDEKLVEIIGVEAIVSDDVRDIISRLANTFAADQDIESLKYMYNRLAEFSDVIGNDLAGRVYNMTVPTGDGINSIKNFIELMDSDHTIVPVGQRIHVIAGYKIIKSHLEELEDALKRGDKKTTLLFDMSGLYYIQSCLSLNFGGGVRRQYKLEKYRKYYADTTKLFTVDSEAIQAIQLGREEVNKIFGRVVSVMQANDAIEDGDKLFAAGEKDKAVTYYATAKQYLEPHVSDLRLDMRELDRKIAACGDVEVIAED